jgi:hypothetical protein
LPQIVHDENGQDPEELQGDPTHPLGFADEFNILGTGIATARLARANIDSSPVANGPRMFGIEMLVHARPPFVLKHRAIGRFPAPKAGLGNDEGWFGREVSRYSYEFSLFLQ